MAWAGAVCVLLAAVALAVDWQVETDRERIARQVVALVRAFERGDRGEMLSYLSPQAVCERALVEFALETVTVEHPLSIKDVQVTLHNEDSVAISTFRANGTVAVRGRSLGHHPSQWRLTWRRMADEWRITRIEELDPLRSEPLHRLGQIGAKLCP